MCIRDRYLNADTQIGQGIKNGDGTCSYRITVTLTNIMTQEEAGKLPDYVCLLYTARCV